MTFRCPADCKDTQLLKPHVVGNESYVYQGLVIGGPDPDDHHALPIYRGDSFICQAAIHAGVIGNSGGCGVATLTGTHSNFHASEANGIQSIGFPSSFPRTFTFQSLSSDQSRCPTNNRWSLLTVTAVALTLLWVFTTSPSVLFLSTFFIVALHIGLVGDPPSSANFHELLSTFFSRLLPASFIAFILCRYCAIPTLGGLTAQFEKPILYLGFTFIGALNNYTFARLIPIQRLTPYDIRNQPGAPIALAIIITAILVIVSMQIHYLRLAGQLPRYLRLYSFFLIGLFILLVLPGWRLRIHHYILALLFMPGTAMQTRSALVYQGLLLGLFINGVMRWGFDSIIQTPFALGEVASSQSGSWFGATWPTVNATVLPLGGERPERIKFDWGDLPRDRGVDGVSVLVNDVERWRGYIDEELYWHPNGVTLERRGWMAEDQGPVLPRNDDDDENLNDSNLSFSHEPSFRTDDTRNTIHHHHSPDPRNDHLQDIVALVSSSTSSLSECLVSSSTPSTTSTSISHSTPTRFFSEPDFYRFAWMSGNTAGRYGGVGVWDEWGDWVPPSTSAEGE